MTRQSFNKQPWTKPSYAAHACGMEVNMYAPDEDGDVLFRAAAIDSAGKLATGAGALADTPTRMTSARPQVQG